MGVVTAHLDLIFRLHATKKQIFNLTNYHEQKNQLQQGMVAHDCNFFRNSIAYKRPGVRMPYNIDFCDVESSTLTGRRSIRRLCPVGCSCNAALKNHCAAIANLSSFTLTTLVGSQCPLSCLQ